MLRCALGMLGLALTNYACQMNQAAYDVQEEKLEQERIDQAARDLSNEAGLGTDTEDDPEVVFKPRIKFYPLDDDEIRQDLACAYEDKDEIMHERCVIVTVYKGKGKGSDDRLKIKYTKIAEDKSETHVNTKCGVKSLYLLRKPRTDEELQTQKEDAAAKAAYNRMGSDDSGAEQE